jgi:hypothetical protein
MRCFKYSISWLAIDPAACGHLSFGSMPYSDI